MKSKIKPFRLAVTVLEILSDSGLLFIIPSIYVHYRLIFLDEVS